MIRPVLICLAVALIGCNHSPKPKTAAKHTIGLSPIKPDIRGNTFKGLTIDKRVGESPRQLTITDLMACNRRTEVYTPTEENTKKLPRPPSYQAINEMAQGQSGWISYLQSHNGQLYVDSMQQVAPNRTEHTINVYSESTLDYHINIRRAPGGVLVNCSTEAFVIPDDRLHDTAIFPVVGMFREGK